MFIDNNYFLSKSYELDKNLCGKSWNKAYPHRSLLLSLAKKCRGSFPT